jgi:hypothetical protein
LPFCQSSSRRSGIALKKAHGLQSQSRDLIWPILSDKEFENMIWESESSRVNGTYKKSPKNVDRQRIDGNPWRFRSKQKANVLPNSEQLLIKLHEAVLYRFLYRRDRAETGNDAGN